MSKSPFMRSLREHMTTRRYALRTIQTYSYWIHLFIIYNGKQHPESMHEAEVVAFLDHISNVRNVSINTQKTALNALVYLYDKFLEKPLGMDLRFNKSITPRKLPIVLSPYEVAQLLNAVAPPYKLPTQMLYGSGLRLTECLRLRVQDIDFNYLSVRVWNGKGGKHRQVTLAPELTDALKQQIKLSKDHFLSDSNQPYFAGVWLPDALARKYPKAPFELGVLGTFRPKVTLIATAHAS